MSGGIIGGRSIRGVPASIGGVSTPFKIILAVFRIAGSLATPRFGSPLRESLDVPTPAQHVGIVHETCVQSFCPVCSGGLFVCSVCGSVEGATTTHCPGEKLSADILDAVYSGVLDFRDGAWGPECSPHCPSWLMSAEGRAAFEREYGDQPAVLSLAPQSRMLTLNWNRDKGNGGEPDCRG